MNDQRPFTKNHQNSEIENLTKESPTDSNAIQIPQISLPKGGGALKGIDEKFEVNAANGSAGFSIPLPITPGRNNFSPSLSLSYNSGGGNGPFGLGWSVAYPMIQRKTDKRLPRYRDGSEEDIFMLSGAEDLVPFLEKDGNGWMEKDYPNNGADSYTIKRYRPRIEGGFARIEKIHHANHGVYWKVTSRENIATIFGRSPNARIANPEDATQIFQWMPEFSYDDKGNWIKYEYKKENLINVPNEVHEKNRINDIAPFTNVYLKSIKYGNRIAYYADPTKPYDPQPPANDEHFFELVMDYGEHNVQVPAPQDNSQWNYRLDAFSSYRSGFEIRTNRLCKRILMFHHFKDEKQFVGTPEEEAFGENYLVRSLDLEYKPSSINESGQSETTYLTSITQIGYIRKPDGTYSKKSLPPMEFTYEKLNWNKAIKTVSPKNIVNAPVGLTNNYQWVDLYGEGISGILTEQGEGWFYKSNLGNVDDEDGEVSFTVANKVIPKPSFTGLFNGVLSIQDLAANGEKQVVVNSGAVKGYFELTHDNDWKPFRPFEQVANIDLQDPNTRLIDLNGDGQPEIVMTEENVFTWYAADGKRGHLPSEQTIQTFDEERGPAIVFADQLQTIFLADMSGDGLTDIVRIRNGEVCYWANKGYGKFSAKVSMGNAPLFDTLDLFNPQYLHLADVSGTGATDIIYLGKNKFKAFINLSGNAWSDAHEIEPFFPIDRNSQLSVVDLLGTGTSCIVWSSDLPSHTNAPMRYIDLMDSKKPHVLIHYKNNFGKETSIQYKSSTHYYLIDKLNGKPWITKLPFPVQVVSKLVVEEKITDVRFTNEYKYHHGYYDHTEREFRGFGMVEQIDTEHYDTYKEQVQGNAQTSDYTLYQPPVLTKTWFHTGAFLDRERILTRFENEYWHKVFYENFDEPSTPDARLAPEVRDLAGDEFREALRACKGMMLRQEVFALDAPKENPTQLQLDLEKKPYTVASHNCNIQLLQPKDKNEFGVFLVTESEAITIHYERDETDYRLGHTLNTRFDNLGNVLESASVVYSRNQLKADADFQTLSDSITDFSEDVLDNDATQKTQLLNAFTSNIKAAKDEQTKTHVIYTQNNFAKFRFDAKDYEDIDLAKLPNFYRTRLPYETKTYEITGLNPARDIFTLGEVENILTDASFSPFEYHQDAAGAKGKRLIEHVKTRYLKDGLTLHDFEYFDTLALPFENYQLAYTPDLLTDIFGNKLPNDQNDFDKLIGREIDSNEESECKFLKGDDGFWWIRSGFTHFKEDTENIDDVKERFYSPIKFEDPFGSITKVKYDNQFLFVKETEDAIGNKIVVDIFNYRTLSPNRMIDLNANPSSVLLDELGLVKAMAVEGNGDFDDINGYTLADEDKADDFEELKAYTDDAEKTIIDEFFGSATSESTNTATLRTKGNVLLQHASVRFVYYFDVYKKIADENEQFIATGESEKVKPLKPVVVASIVREEHHNVDKTKPLPDRKFQFSFEYSDGLGNVAMTKVQAEPGVACYIDAAGNKQEKNTGSDLRWLGNGRTILNNKGNPVKQYEPYFSTNFLYENESALVECGVTPVLYYDALGRLVKTTFPDGTLSRVEFDSWKHLSFDQNDTVEESECLWYLRRTDNSRPDYINDTKEQRAASEAQKHANTPSSLYLDSLGRPILSIANNGKDAGNRDKFFTTFIKLDIEGNARTAIDARATNPDDSRIPVMSYKYDMLGHRIYQNSMDAGERWVLNDLIGNPIRRWDSRNHVFLFKYDDIQRPRSSVVSGGDSGTALDNVYEYIKYGEDEQKQYKLNLRGQVYQQFDTAGRVQNLEFDFKGNIKETTREFNEEYKQISNWTDANRNYPTFDNDLTVYRSKIEYDALNRAINTITPDESETKPGFNEAGLLEAVSVDMLPANGVGAKQNKLFVKNIDYDAKGQREKIVYADKNGDNLAITKYTYDRQTYRLTHLETKRGDGNLLQDLYYTYDPVGNITEIEDKAIPTKFFNNQKIEGKASYRYDALYQLKEATGREHAGQAIDFGQCDNWRDKAFLKSYSPSDDMAFRNYTQKYSYDPVGNILMTDHKSNGGTGNWTRTYEYEKTNNRLKNTKVGGQTYTYPYHPKHGFINSMPHLSLVQWNFKDELQATARQVYCKTDDPEDNPPETTYYIYDATGQRVRKVTENNGGGSKKEERLYLGGIEIYKKHSGNHNDLERTTLHMMDDTRRIAMVDTRNTVNDNTDWRTVRFQFSNHLGSASLELDDKGDVINYEEYHPYGTTSHQAVNKNIKAAAKRYRYTGMERDEESGLEYHSARYYLVWLGRWLKPDPIGVSGGINIYQYSNNQPIKSKDVNGLMPEQMGFWEHRIYQAEVTATYSGRGISPSLRRAMTGVYRAWSGDYASKVDVGHLQKPQVLLRAGEVTKVGPQLAGPNRSQGATVERAAAAKARSLGQFARDTAGRDMSPSGLASKGTRYRSRPLPASFSDPAIIQAGNARRAAATPGPVSAAKSVPVAANAAPEQLSFNFSQTTSTPKSPAVSLGSRILSGTGRALSTTGRFIGSGLGVLGAAAGGAQVGTGFNQVLEGKTGEGVIGLGEGASNLALTIGTAIAVKAKVVVAEKGLAAWGTTLLAGVAAAGSIALAGEESRRALKGQPTMAQEAVQYWEKVQNDLVSEEPSFAGGVKYVGAEFAKGLAGFVAGGQKNLWGLL